MFHQVRRFLPRFPRFAALCSFPDLHYIFVTGSHFIEDSVEAA